MIKPGCRSTTLDDNSVTPLTWGTNATWRLSISMMSISSAGSCECGVDPSSRRRSGSVSSAWICWRSCSRRHGSHQATPTHWGYGIALTAALARRAGRSFDHAG